ncbi:hypothetical protein [Flavobacterium agrisoli]|uniref:Lipoprotein n=1 Tax=Flavobacterium agrisoli TaxID=2793066 RepID=A0A934UKH4_9FLAO|nr:hypothetical protein [Flavobacterium agrisoli]MBK0370563.1 hypothetical protein [Flavobacterium agrisoli]
MKKTVLFLSLSLAFLISCNDKKQTTESIEKTEQTLTDTTAVQKTVTVKTDSTEQKLIAFLKDDYLKNDYDILMEQDHSFQYETVDLNGDAIPETFIRFSSPYFCGSGGCTFLLLDADMKLINSFSVSDGPFYITKEIQNGWPVLNITSGNALRIVVFNGKKYPSNPSVLPKVTTAPTDAQVIFDKPFAESKTVNF